MNPIRIKYADGDHEPVFYVGSEKFGLEDFQSNFSEQRLNLVLREHISKLCTSGAVVIGEGSGNPTDGLGHEVAQSASIRLLDADVHIVCGELNGGVYASIVGTIELLPPDIRKRVKSIFINRFNNQISFKVLDEFREYIKSAFGIGSIIVIPTFASLKHNKEDVPFDRKATKDVRKEVAFLSEITASSSPEFASLFS